jgi:hypothetical protein
MDDEEEQRHLRSVVVGVSRGLAIALGVMLTLDAGAVGDATGWWSLPLHHPSLLVSLIMTLLPVAVLLEFERERHRAEANLGFDESR